MGCEGVCGALSASIAVISALKIQDKAHGTPGFRTLCGDYVALFEKELGSTNCHELKKKYFKKETTHCLETVEKTADLLEKFLEQHR
jgi:C_GCAxxG_C_C family probable redox protein